MISIIESYSFNKFFNSENIFRESPIHPTKGIRLFSGAAYFVTIVTHKRKLLFGITRNGKMNLNHFGLIVQKSWLNIPNHFPRTALDEFVLIPNHLHGIILITGQKKGMACRALLWDRPTHQ